MNDLTGVEDSFPFFRSPLSMIHFLLSVISGIPMKHLLQALSVMLVPLMLFAQSPGFRPPATPLVTHDPYFSVWSFADRPQSDVTRHWTGKSMGMFSMVSVDGLCFRLMGPYPEEVPAMEGVTLSMTPTSTTYQYAGAGIVLNMTFLSPLLPDSLTLLSRPLTYITWTAQSTDGKRHAVKVYFEHTAELCLNSAVQDVAWGRVRLEGMDVLRMGSSEQPVLKKRGDDLRIDWGSVYLAIPQNQNASTAIAPARISRKEFLTRGTVPASDELTMPRPGNDDWVTQAVAFDLRMVDLTPVSVHAMLAYDDRYSVEFLQRRLPAYWTRGGVTIAEVLRTGAASYRSLVNSCAEFDIAAMKRFEERGGKDFAQLCMLAYRQVIAAHKLAIDIDGSPMFFPKENFSNGCISTVDVIYPSAPIFLAFNPTLLEAVLRPVLEYAKLPRWRFPFAPHDVGTYPLANGQVYGGGELDETDQMPVEETGNMIILMYAHAKTTKNPDFALRYMPLLRKWATYLKEKGLDPENQLCTDDFTGHLAHNTNLSAKAIVALGCYAKLCELAGEKAEAATFRALAKQYAGEWESMARDGDHYRLAFDKPGTWSMKYNLVWDRMLGLHLFPSDVAAKELAYYRTKLNAFGLPLDNRADFTKPEWMIWVATMSGDRATIADYARTILAYLNATPDRVPFCDWYDTKTAKKCGFQARSPLGGLYIPLLDPVR
jgi:hypothetical protein